MTTLRDRARLALPLLVLIGCKQQMRNQPHYEPLEPSMLFPDGASARTEVAGTIPNGALERELLPTSPTRASLERGRDEYAIHCTPCHGQLGAGDGMVVRQGFPRPRPFTAPALRSADDQELFAAITDGYGVMAGYARLLDDEQRWAITQWIRVLQLSQRAPVEALSACDLAALEVES